MNMMGSSAIARKSIGRADELKLPRVEFMVCTIVGYLTYHMLPVIRELNDSFMKSAANGYPHGYLWPACDQFPRCMSAPDQPPHVLIKTLLGIVLPQVSIQVGPRCTAVDKVMSARRLIRQNPYTNSRPQKMVEAYGYNRA
jgi:hypothetical protein